MPSFDTMLLPVFRDIKPTAQSIEQARSRVEAMIGRLKSLEQHT